MSEENRPLYQVVDLSDLSVNTVKGNHKKCHQDLVFSVKLQSKYRCGVTEAKQHESGSD